METIQHETLAISEDERELTDLLRSVIEIKTEYYAYSYKELEMAVQGVEYTTARILKERTSLNSVARTNVALENRLHRVQKFQQIMPDISYKHVYDGLDRNMSLDDTPIDDLLSRRLANALRVQNFSFARKLIEHGAKFSSVHLCDFFVNFENIQVLTFLLEIGDSLKFIQDHYLDAKSPAVVKLFFELDILSIWTAEGMMKDLGTDESFFLKIDYGIYTPALTNRHLDILFHLYKFEYAYTIMDRALINDSSSTEEFHYGGLSSAVNCPNINEKQRLAVVDTLLHCYGFNIDAKDRFHPKPTVLLSAAGALSPEIIVALMTRGANCYLSDSNYQGVIFYALNNSHDSYRVEILQLLLRQFFASSSASSQIILLRPVNVLALSTQPMSNDTFSHILNLLQQASSHVSFDWGVFPHKPNRQQLLASGYHEQALLLLFINPRVGFDINQRDEYTQRTALHLFCGCLSFTTGLADDALNINCIKVLLTHGADPMALDRWHRTPIFYAVFHNDRDVINLLLNFGATLEVPETCFAANFNVPIWKHMMARKRQLAFASNMAQQEEEEAAMRN